MIKILFALVFVFQNTLILSDDKLNDFPLYIQNLRAENYQPSFKNWSEKKIIDFKKKCKDISAHVTPMGHCYCTNLNLFVDPYKNSRCPDPTRKPIVENTDMCLSGCPSSSRVSQHALDIITSGLAISTYDLFEEYFKFSICSKKEEFSFRKLEEIKDKLSRMNLSNVDLGPIIYEFINEKYAKDVRVFEHCIPDLTKIGDSKYWVDWLDKNVRKQIIENPSFLKNTDGVFSYNFALQIINLNIMFNVSDGKAGKEDEKKLSGLCYDVYKDFHISDSFPISHVKGEFLQLGSMMGDIRSFKKSKEIFDNFLKIKKNDGNVQQALYAIYSFKTEDSELIKEKGKIISFALSSPDIPDFIKKHLKEAQEARETREARELENLKIQKLHELPMSR